jgi:hypothetical protein
MQKDLCNRRNYSIHRRSKRQLKRPCAKREFLLRVLSYDVLLKRLLLQWTEFIDYGRSVEDEQLEERTSKMAPNKCASLIYTASFFIIVKFGFFFECL